MNEEKIMKKHILLFIMILIPIFAQKSKMQILESKQFISSEPIVSELQTTSVPRKISYQGILTKDNGQPAEETFYNVKFRLYEMFEGGEPFWEESQTIFIKDGFLTATIGISNELDYIPPAAFLEVEVGSSILEPRQEMTSVFYSVLSDTAYYAKGYTKTEDLSAVALSGKYNDLLNIPDTISADLFIGSAAGLTGILADTIGILRGNSPFIFEGEFDDDNQISLKIEEPIIDTEIILPNASGTIITTGNDQLIDEVGIIGSGIWMGESIEDLFIDNDLDILGGEINNSPIGDSIPSTARFTSITTQNGLNIDDGETFLSNEELAVLDSISPGQSSVGKALITNELNDISGIRNINATGVISAESFAGVFTGDGSGITGVSANSIKSDDITAGDAAVTISTSTGAINLTPADGSAVVLDGSVNVDGGAVTGATTITGSGAITGGSITDGTATLTSGALSGVTTLTGSGLATVGSLDVDDVLVDGATIGHTDDTDLVTLSDGTVTVAGTLAATALTGDGSGITGVSANSIKSDDITAGDAAVTISTSTGAINLTPASGSAVVLDGAVNVDAGVVTGVTNLTSSTITDGTATLTSGALSGVTTLTGSGLATVGSLDVDDVLVDGATIGHTDDTDLVTLSDGTVTVAGEITVTTLDIGGADVTSTAAELNIMDGVTATTAELNLIDGVTATTAELNIMDGNTSASSTTIVDADQIVLNDGGIMKQIAMTDLANYVASGSDLDILSDAKSEGTNFTGSLILGHETTGTLNAAEYNTGVGIGSLDAITEGDNNTAVGYNSLSANTTGSDNIAIGYNALVANTTKGQNIAIGRNALQVQTDGGEFNVAVGAYSLDENTYGDKNVALGYVALGKNTEAGNNTGIGAEALKLNTTGTYNTGLGSAAGDALGTGSQNVLIGASADPSAADATNQIVIGYGATGQADNSVTLGNADVTAVYMAQDQGATVHAASLSLENDETITNSTDTQIDMSSTTLVIGNGSVDPTIKSNGNKDLTLQTGASNTGSIVIRDGSDNNIDIAPHGTGKIDLNDSPLTGFGADVQAETGTSRGLLASDNGTIINCSNGSAISITIPDNLPTGFNCMIIQSGSGRVTLSASSSATLNNKNGLLTSGQYAIMTLVHLGSDVFIISGDTASS